MERTGLKIALAQLNPTIGDLEGNSQKIIRACQASEKAGADLVVFSELVLTGYPPRDLLYKPDLVCEGQKALEFLVDRIQGPAVLLGHVGKRKTGTGKGLTNSAVLFQNGRILAQADKVLLPTYDVFDETRYFQAADHPVVYELSGTKLGLTICEDIWNFPDFYDQDIYQSNPVEELAQSRSGYHPERFLFALPCGPLAHPIETRTAYCQPVQTSLRAGQSGGGQ